MKLEPEPVKHQSALEDRKLALEIALKELELAERSNALTRRTGFLSRMNVTAVEATMLVALVGFIGSMAAAYLQQGNQIAINKQESRAQLVLEAMKGQNPSENLNKLRLLLEAGLLTDDDNRISNLIASGKYGLVAAASSAKLIDALASGSVPDILARIIEITGLAPDITLVQLDDLGAVAYAWKNGDKAELVFGRRQVAELTAGNLNNWTSVGILAHEVGHIVLRHFDRPRCLRADSLSDESNCLSIPELELAADRFAGFVLRRLGADIHQAAGIMSFAPEVGDASHPGRDDRQKAVRAGWTANRCESC